jgi:hypothetical protein
MLQLAVEAVVALQVLYRDAAEEVVVAALVQYFEVPPQLAALQLVRVGSLRSRKQIPSLLRLAKFSSSSSNWTSQETFSGSEKCNWPSNPVVLRETSATQTF